MRIGYAQTQENTPRRPSPGSRFIRVLTPAESRPGVLGGTQPVSVASRRAYAVPRALSPSRGTVVPVRASAPPPKTSTVALPPRKSGGTVAAATAPETPTETTKTPMTSGGYTVCEVITGLLQDRVLLKRAVLQCFDRTRGEAETLDMDALKKFRGLLSWVLETPNEAFGDVEQSFAFFDFDGSGLLDVEEVYRLVKYHLREYRKALGGETKEVGMPHKTLEQGGYTIVRELGRGNQGIVHLAVTRSGHKCCVKALEKKQTSAATIEELQDEFLAMQEVACDRVGKVYEVFQDSLNYYMIGEAYLGGDFLTLKSRATEQGVSMDECWWKGIFFQCFEAVSFLQRLAVIHCDIKEPNLMLKTPDFFDPQVVLVDFGLSRVTTSTSGGCGGTPGYIPPETIKSLRWYPKGDIFSLGVTLIQVLIDCSPPQGARTVTTPGGIFVEGCATLQDIMKATLSRQIPFGQLPKAWPGMKRVLQSALQKDMGTRLTAWQVLRSAWFRHGVPCPQSSRPRRDTGITRSILLEMRGGKVVPVVKEEHSEAESTASPTSARSPSSAAGLQAFAPAKRSSGHPEAPSSAQWQTPRQPQSVPPPFAPPTVVRAVSPSMQKGFAAPVHGTSYTNPAAAGQSFNGGGVGVVRQQSNTLPQSAVRLSGYNTMTRSISPRPVPFRQAATTPQVPLIATAQQVQAATPSGGAATTYGWPTGLPAQAAEAQPAPVSPMWSSGPLAPLGGSRTRVPLSYLATSSSAGHISTGLPPAQPPGQAPGVQQAECKAVPLRTMSPGRIVRCQRQLSPHFVRRSVPVVAGGHRQL